MTYISDSPEETEEIAAAFSKMLQPGDVIAYTGGLGAGKTAFTRGLARGLGIREPVTSPTYTIVNEYESGSVPLFHFDLYRLESDEDLFDIGWEDYLERGGICAVEWSENAPELMREAIKVSISRDGSSDSARIISIEGARFS